jgi:peptide/nickel transport system substrate-binding protein
VDNTIVSSAEALDDHTVVFYLSQPYAPFFQTFAGALPILPQHIWEGVTEPETFLGDEAVIGTGPYTLGDYNKEQGTYLYLAYNDYYLGTPAVDEIKFIKISNELTPAALEDGTVSMGSIQADITADFEAQGFTIITTPPSWNAKLTINHQKEPLSSKEFRQALAYAIDRQQLVDITQRGYAMAGSPGLLPPTSAWYNPDIPQYEYDVAKAQELLTGLGYILEGDYFTKDGEVLELSLIAAADFQEVGQFIQQQLEDAGINIDFTTLESKTVDSRVGAWDFDLSIYGHGGLYDPSILKTTILDDGFNSARYTANETLTGLIMGQFNEMDEVARKDMILQAQRLYAEDLPALSLYYPESYTAHDGSLDLFYTIDGIAIGVPIPLNRTAFVD